MSKFVTVPEMLAIEKAADQAGHSYAQMMVHAGHSIVEVLGELFDGEFTAVALVGKGNNGGDALVALTELQMQGCACSAVLSEPREDELTAAFTKTGGTLKEWATLDEAALTGLLAETDIFLDALLGTGIQLPLRQKASQILKATGIALAACDPAPLVLAVDCPSGMDCQTGEIAPETIAADLTVTMAAVKQGMLSFPAFVYVGELVVGDIGLPAGLKQWDSLQHYVMDQGLASTWLPQRAMNAHKGDFGKVLVIAGSREYPGAALISAKGAARSGAGLVSLASHSGLKASFAGHIQEVTWTRMRKIVAQTEMAQNDDDALSGFTSILLGPGLNKQVWKELALDKVISREGLPAMVFDAFALRMFAKTENWWQLIPKHSVLTPHPGEFSELTGLSTHEIQSNRLDLAAKYAAKWGQIVLLKGALTVIADPQVRLTVVPVANPALASAGSGDVLSGMIAALLAQGLKPFEAASVAAWAHAEAALLASDYFGSTRGILASDLIEFLPEVLQ